MNLIIKIWIYNKQMNLLIIMIILNKLNNSIEKINNVLKIILYEIIRWNIIFNKLINYI